MEALTAVSVACLTLYDMLKAADRAMTIDGVRLLENAAARRATISAAEFKPAKPAFSKIALASGPDR